MIKLLVVLVCRFVSIRSHIAYPKSKSGQLRNVTNVLPVASFPITSQQSSTLLCFATSSNVNSFSGSGAMMNYDYDVAWVRLRNRIMEIGRDTMRTTCCRASSLESKGRSDADRRPTARRQEGDDDGPSRWRVIFLCHFVLRELSVRRWECQCVRGASEFNKLSVRRHTSPVYPRVAGWVKKYSTWQIGKLLHSYYWSPRTDGFERLSVVTPSLRIRALPGCSKYASYRRRSWEAAMHSRRTSLHLTPFEG